jgi:hypothetical protein
MSRHPAASQPVCKQGHTEMKADIINITGMLGRFCTSAWPDLIRQPRQTVKMTNFGMAGHMPVAFFG